MSRSQSVRTANPIQPKCNKCPDKWQHTFLEVGTSSESLSVLTFDLTHVDVEHKRATICSFVFSLTSEMKVAQMMCDKLLGSFLHAVFDSTLEKDVSFPACDGSMALTRNLYIRNSNDTWKRHRLLTVR